jgi:hypothetical protein
MELEGIANVPLDVEAQTTRRALGWPYREVDFVVGAFDLKDLSK